MFVLPPGASVPLVAESVSQAEELFAVQFIDAPPALLTVYVWLLGLNGPPGGPPDDES